MFSANSTLTSYLILPNFVVIHGYIRIIETNEGKEFENEKI